MGVLMTKKLLIIVSMLAALPACNSGKPASSTRVNPAPMFGKDAGPVVGNSSLPAPKVALLGELSHPIMRTPNRVALAPNGDIVVSDPAGGAVHVFAPWGQRKFAITSAKRPLSCAVDGEGKIYVGDKATGSVRIHRGTGQFLTKLGKGDGEFKMPNELEVAAKEKVVFVADSKADQIRAFDTLGTSMFLMGTSGTGAGAFHFPTGMVFDSAKKRLYIADHSNGRVQVFSHTGKFISTLGVKGAGKGKFTRPQGLAIDAKERLYVVDTFQGQLQLVDKLGLHVGYLGKFGTKKGQLSIPSDAALGPAGRLYVTSYRTGKVLIYGIDGAKAAPQPLAGKLLVRPADLSKPTRERTFTVRISLPNTRPRDINLASLTLNGMLVPVPGSARYFRKQRSGPAALEVQFDRKQLAVALPIGGVQTLSLYGALGNKKAFVASQQVTMEVPK